ncbi:hypothetical protein RQP46_003840 [Phenoliferia psychrophenolica]
MQAAFFARVLPLVALKYSCTGTESQLPVGNLVLPSGLRSQSPAAASTTGSLLSIPFFKNSRPRQFQSGTRPFRTNAQQQLDPTPLPLAQRDVAWVAAAPDEQIQHAVLLGSLVQTYDQPVQINNDPAQFEANRDTLVSALDELERLVKEFKQFNQDTWTIHYVHQLGISLGAVSQNVPPAPGSVAATPTEETAPSSSSHPLSILSLDLRLGHPTAPTPSLPSLLPSLSVETISILLSRRLTTSLTHLAQLRTRVLDNKSRILVTGDLNAGKSTLVNALLRRDVMPSDQQPCTTVFCEVLDAALCNDGNEEIHAVRDVARYDLTDESTYDRFSLEDVNEVQDSPADTYQFLKAYVTDSRAPLRFEDANPSFIKNDLVSLSIIDSPGLNVDSVSTTALFARQSEIDVIIFVVSAENHFTLSAQEFLKNASLEKAYVFIVVNKWAAIKDKKRCMRRIGEQIKQLSPATWEARAELVHFVDAADAVDSPEHIAERDSTTLTRGNDEPSTFGHLEQSLRSFVLLKRSRSKLAPAKHYLLNLLTDLPTLANENILVASNQLSAALAQLALVKPIHERLSAQRDAVGSAVEEVEETIVEMIKTSARARLQRAIGFVAEGQVVPPSPTDATRARFDATDSLLSPTALPTYPGVFGIWSWAGEVKRTLVRTLEAEVRSAEDDARVVTTHGVKSVMTDLAQEFFPGEEMEASNARVFRPEVMFAKRRRGLGRLIRLAARGVYAGLGLGSAGVGLGSTWSTSELEISFLDFFDLERLMGRSGSGKKQVEVEDDTLETGAIVSLGLGSIGIIGSKLVGLTGTLDSVTRVMDVLVSKQAREWAAPFVAVLTIGVTAYLVYDLPRALPRNIGRKLLEASLSTPSASSSSSSHSSTFASVHSERIACEARKVLRVAGWDLRERFRASLEKSATERRGVEQTMGRAKGAIEWLSEFAERVGHEETRVLEVEV